MDGVVRTYNLDEGYGWISVEGEEDVWVHFSGIKPDPIRFPPKPPSTTGFRFLKPGQRVQFEISQTHRGDNGARSAISVLIVAESSGDEPLT